MQFPKVLFASLVVFLSPLAVVAALNWDSFQPYITGDPETADGKLLYFYADT